VWNSHDAMDSARSEVRHTCWLPGMLFIELRYIAGGMCARASVAVLFQVILDTYAIYYFDVE
jgi:hypothetical protein